MRPLDLNLASRPFHNNILPSIGIVAAVVLVVLFTGYNIVTFGRHSRTVASLNAELADGRGKMEQVEREAERLRRQIDSRNLGELGSRIKAANDILLKREFSWTRLLNSLEEAQPYKVRLLELRPAVTPEGVLIRARGIAKDLENLWELEQRLQDHPMFRRVYPDGYQKTPQAAEFMFTLSFNYFPNPEDAPPDGQPAAVTPETVAGQFVTPAAAESGEEAPAGEAPAEETPAAGNEADPPAKPAAAAAPAAPHRRARGGAR